MASQKQARKGKAEPTSEPVAFGISCVYSDLCVFFPPENRAAAARKFSWEKGIKKYEKDGADVTKI